MDFSLTDEQKLLVQNLKELLQREVPESYLAECDNGHKWPAKGVKVLAENGYLGIGQPEEYGGTPADCVTQVLIAETIARYAGVLSNIYTNNFYTGHDIAEFCNEEQKKELIPKIISGNLIVGIAITEPQAGSDDAAMTTTAKIEGDKVIINGQKTWASLSDIADYMILLTRDLENPNPYKAVSMWLLPTKTPGVTINPIPKMCMWSMNSCEMFLDNVVLPKSALMGELNGGWKQLMSNFGFERTGIGATCLGYAQAALDDAATYANRRMQFGAPIGTYQLVQRYISEMATKVEVMRNLIYKVAWMVDTGQPIRVEAAMIKTFCANNAFEVIDDAMQIFGGIGVMASNRVQRMWRDIRLMRIGGGTDEMMVRAIAPMVLKEYK